MIFYRSTRYESDAVWFISKETIVSPSATLLACLSETFEPPKIELAIERRDIGVLSKVDRRHFLRECIDIDNMKCIAIGCPLEMGRAETQTANWNLDRIFRKNESSSCDCRAYHVNILVNIFSSASHSAKCKSRGKHLENS